MVESGLPLGGARTGRHSSLLQWVARQLSQYIRDTEDSLIEGAFLSTVYLESMLFAGANQQIETSPNDEYSIFRWRAAGE
ncbi:MAG: hypothetical protein HS103_06420 [Anaerolineales bacterium]|nr:hypothetical protein [Anaerolineales bacterium]